MKNEGKGWIVIAEHTSRPRSEVVSVLPARRGLVFVAQFMQQTYVDRFGSIDEQIEFKRNPSGPRFALHRDDFNGLTSIGNDPTYIALYAQRIVNCGTSLSIDYHRRIRTSNLIKPTFDLHTRVLSLADKGSR